MMKKEGVERVEEEPRTQKRQEGSWAERGHAISEDKYFSVGQKYSAVA